MSNSDALIEVLKKNQTGNKFFFAPDIPGKKMKGAKKALNIPDTEEILCIIDNTVFGSAKEGIVFTRTTMYSRATMEQPQQIKYKDFHTFSFQEQGKYDVIARSSDGREFTIGVAAAEIKPAEFAELLHRVRRLFHTGLHEDATQGQGLTPTQRHSQAPPTTPEIMHDATGAAMGQSSGNQAVKYPGLIEQLPGGIKKALDENLSSDELIHVSILGNAGEAMVITEERVIIIKAGFSSGAMFGQKAKSFLFEHITSVEVSCGLFEGRIQVTTAGTGEASHGWRQDSALDAAIDARQVENIVTFFKDDKQKFQKAAEVIRNMISRQRAPQNVLQQQIIHQQDSIPDMLKKIAELRASGILTEEEYLRKKKDLLDRM